MATAIPSLPPPIPLGTTESTTSATAPAGGPSFEQVLVQQRAPSDAPPRPAPSGQSSPPSSSTAGTNKKPESSATGATTTSTPPANSTPASGHPSAEKTTAETPDGHADPQADASPALAADERDADADRTVDPTPTDLVDLSLVALAESAVAGPVLPANRQSAAHAAAATSANTNPTPTARSKAKATSSPAAPSGKLAVSSRPAAKDGPPVAPTNPVTTPGSAAGPAVVSQVTAEDSAPPSAPSSTGDAVTEKVAAPADARAETTAALADVPPSAQTNALAPAQDIASLPTGPTTGATHDSQTTAAVPGRHGSTEAPSGIGAIESTPTGAASRGSRETANAPSVVPAAAENRLTLAVASGHETVDGTAPPAVASATEPLTAALVETLTDVATRSARDTVDAGTGASPTTAQHHAGLTSTPQPSTSQVPERSPAAGGAPGPHSASPLHIDRVRFVQRVARAFQVAGQRESPLRLRLSPPELGSVRIEIRLQDGVMQARLEAETPAAQAALLEGLPALRDRLADQKIRLDRFDVDLLQERSTDSSSRQSAGGPRDQADRSAMFPPAGNPRRQSAPPTTADAPRSGGFDTPGQLNVIV